MNRAIYIGRLTRNPEIRYTSGEESTMVASYTLAVDRYKGEDGKREADFIQCEAWGGSALFAERYLQKGMKILVEGATRTGSYTNKNGQKVYTNVCRVDHHEFVEKKSEADEYMTLPDDESVPF